MNAPPKIDPVTAHSDSDVVHWLMNDTRDERFIDNIFAELCVRLQRAGIPVKRATLHILIYHPQWLGARLTGMPARWSRTHSSAKILSMKRSSRVTFISQCTTSLSECAVTGSIFVGAFISCS